MEDTETLTNTLYNRYIGKFKEDAMKDVDPNDASAVELFDNIWPICAASFKTGIECATEEMISLTETSAEADKAEADTEADKAEDATSTYRCICFMCGDCNNLTAPNLAVAEDKLAKQGWRADIEGAEGAWVCPKCAKDRQNK